MMETEQTAGMPAIDQSIGHLEQLYQTVTGREAPAPETPAPVAADAPATDAADGPNAAAASGDAAAHQDHA